MFNCTIYKSDKRTKHYYVYIDSSLIGILYRRDLEDLQLHIPCDGEKSEKDVDERVYDKIWQMVEEHAYSKAVSILTVSEYCAKEIRTKLEMRRYSKEIIDEVITQLYEIRYLDDERYAEAYIHTYAGRKSRDLIHRELEMKDIFLNNFDEIYNNVINDDGIDENELINNILEKKFENYDLKDEKIKNRAVRYLSQRGFMVGEIIRQINKRQ